MGLLFGYSFQSWKVSNVMTTALDFLYAKAFHFCVCTVGSREMASGELDFLIG